MIELNAPPDIVIPVMLLTTLVIGLAYKYWKGIP